MADITTLYTWRYSNVSIQNFPAEYAAPPLRSLFSFSTASSIFHFFRSSTTFWDICLSRFNRCWSFPLATSKALWNKGRDMSMRTLNLPVAPCCNILLYCRHLCALSWFHEICAWVPSAKEWSWLIQAHSGWLQVNILITIQMMQDGWCRGGFQEVKKHWF